MLVAACVVDGIVGSRGGRGGGGGHLSSLVGVI